MRTYVGVQRRVHHALIEDAVEAAGGRVLHSTGGEVAPLFMAVEDASGQRHGILAYVFLANQRVTRNRPADEHRMQIRYGDVNDPAWRAQAHPVGLDPTGVDLTIVVGAHPQAGLLVALDPLIYDPLPIGISVFFKDDELAAARRHHGWHVWERDNLSGARRATPRSTLGVETLIAFAPDRFFDFIALEREAQSLGLDPPLRFRAAERIGGRGARPGKPTSSGRRTEPPSRVPGSPAHELEREYALGASDILQIIRERSRLAMAVRGGVAEHHAGLRLREDPAVARVETANLEGPPDYVVTMRSGAEVRVEVKNASRATYADGTAKVEVQKTRASKGDPLSRYYAADAFDVLAACMYGPTGRWTFKFRRSALLSAHPAHPDRIAPLQRVGEGWRDSLDAALSAT